MAKEATTSEMGMSKGQTGHLYIQTNEIDNAIIHYTRQADGKLAEVARIKTGGAGSGEFKPISGQDSAPNSYEGAGSVIITSDRRFLFATNGGDNSVSSFRLESDGRLTLLDVKSTGNPVEGRSGTAKSLAFAPSTRTLFVLHAFGPDHLRLMSVDAEGTRLLRRQRAAELTADLLQTVGIDLAELVQRNLGAADFGHRGLPEPAEDVGDAPHAETDDQHAHHDGHDGLAEPV